SLSGPTEKGMSGKINKLRKGNHNVSSTKARTRSKTKGLDQTCSHGDPKGGILQTQTGTIWSDLSQNARMLWLHNHREDHSRTGGNNSRVRQKRRKSGDRRARLPGSTQVALPAVGALRHQR